MNKTQWYVKSLRTVERNRRAWVSPLATRDGLSFYPRIVASYIYRLFTGRKAMRYLGHHFVYDSPTTPINMALYHGEVGYQVLGHVAGGASTIHDVLDIGGNIGQFTVTLKRLAPHAEVDTFEPNHAVLPYLRQNVQDLAGVRVFPFAVGPPSSPQTLYYEPSRSGLGSLLAGNGGGGVFAGTETIEVDVVSDVPAVTGKAKYDLVKIDVEGFEANVLRALAGLRMRYLYVELSSRMRQKDYLHSELFELLRRQFGDFDLLCQEQFNGADAYFSVLFEFVGPPAG